LPGGDFSGTFEELSSFVQAQGLRPEEADRVIRMYGKEAFSVFAEKKGVAAEVEQAVLNEGALTLEDFWFRRSSRASFSMDTTLADLEEAAGYMSDLLGWSDQEKARQIAACRERQEDEMSFSLQVQKAAHS
jgi:glycerol-3-phosphate dehydrogenase